MHLATGVSSHAKQQAILFVMIIIIYVHIAYTKASNGICKCTYILPRTKRKQLQKGDKFTVHSLDLNISSEDEVTTVSGTEFQILIIRTEKKLDLKFWRGVDTGLSLMEFM